MDEVIRKIEQRIKEAHDGKLIAYSSSEVMAYVGGLEYAIKMMEGKAYCDIHDKNYGVNEGCPICEDEAEMLRIEESEKQNLFEDVN